MTTLSDFLPSYPPYDRSDNELFNVYDEQGYYPEMYETLRRKKEFNELTLLSSEEILPGTLLKHQQFIQRFLSSYTPYHSLLLWHEVGTGKTLTSLAVAENLKHVLPKRALILVKGRSVERTFRKEIRIHFPSYVPILEDKKASLRQINATINETYEISTFHIFSNEIESFCNDKASPEKIAQLRDMYSNRVIIIDEVHNLRQEKGKQNAYDIIHRFLHIVENCKILLLSATPIKNSVEEFAAIMNLLLPMDKQFSITTFTEDYFTKEDQLIADKRQELIDKIRGYISYLRQSKNQAQRIDKGIVLPTIKGFSIVPLLMGSYQSIYYKQAIDADGGIPSEDQVQRYVIEQKPIESQRKIIEDDEDTTGGIYQDSRQAILACFPERSQDQRLFSYGSGKHEKIDESKERESHYVPDYYRDIALSMIKIKESDETELAQLPLRINQLFQFEKLKIETEQYGADRELLLQKLTEKKEEDNKRILQERRQKHLDTLQLYSSKYHYVVTYLLQPENKDRKSFIYGEFIGGSGLFLLEQLLVQFNFKPCLPKKQKENPFRYLLDEVPRRRYAIITSKLSDSEISFLLDIFNDPLNDRGDYICAILGSKTMSESHNLKCIRDVIILTPHWNYTETEQAIGRGIRTGSHRTLPESEHNVTVHRLVSLLPGNIRTIDQYMYEVSYKKDVMIKQIEYAARESAIDCTFNKERNTFNASFNDKRECFYTTCNYTCMDEKPITKPDLTDTYNLFYTEKEYQKIKQILQLQFSTSNHFSYSFDELLGYIRDQVTFPLHVMLRCIIEIIQRQEPFINSLGFISYVKEKDNEFFLSYHVLQAKIEDIYYTQQGELYPETNPFEYIKRLEYASFETLMKELLTSNVLQGKRILSILPRSVSILFFKSFIEILYDPLHDRSIEPYLYQLLTIGKELDLVFSNHTIRSYYDSMGELVPPERYEETAQGFQWVKQDWTMEKIQKLVHQLETDETIQLYGFRSEGKLYIYDLKEKKNLRQLKRSGTECTTGIPIQELQKYYSQLDPGHKILPDTKKELCVLIQDKLEQRPVLLDGETIPISLLVDEYVHEKMRNRIEEEQEEKEKDAKEAKLAKKKK